MKHILFVHSSSELYGSDRALLNMIKYIDSKKYKCFVVLPEEGPLVSELEKMAGVTVTVYKVAVLRRKNLSVKGMAEYLREYRDSIKFLKAYIRQHKIDLVDTNTAVVFPGAIAAKKCGIKSVWHVREIIKSKVENIFVSKIMARYGDLIVANSYATKEALRVSPHKICVVHDGVEGNENAALMSHKGFVVGMAGRINRWKGQKLFVDAAEIVHKSFPEIRFQIAGDVFLGEDFLREDLVRYIKEKHLEGVVTLLGQVDDMAGFYSKLDVFVLPSIQPEPFGLVVIEAMDYGLPVVATDHGGPTEIIEDGKNGLLVDYQNGEQMADRIMELYLSPAECRRIGGSGRDKKRRMFSVERMAKQMEEVFEQFLL